jgi:lipooligosaccharide transport system permease protein
VPYLDYLAPGLLATTAVQIGVGEAMWPVLGSFEWNRLYHAMRATPLRPSDLVGGELLYLVLRTGVPALSFLVVMIGFGTVHSAWAPAAVPAAILVGLSLSGMVLAFSATIKNDSMFALLFRFGVIPMMLFAGVYFPVEAMPLVAQWVAYALPLWHGVELCRYATLGLPSALPVVGHVLYLAIWAGVGYALARWRFGRRLSD